MCNHYHENSPAFLFSFFVFELLGCSRRQFSFSLTSTQTRAQHNTMNAERTAREKREQTLNEQLKEAEEEKDEAKKDWIRNDKTGMSEDDKRRKVTQ
jgi:hypothetical protein